MNGFKMVFVYQFVIRNIAINFREIALKNAHRLCMLIRFRLVLFVIRPALAAADRRLRNALDAMEDGFYQALLV